MPAHFALILIGFNLLLIGADLFVKQHLSTSTRSWLNYFVLILYAISGGTVLWAAIVEGKSADLPVWLSWTTGPIFLVMVYVFIRDLTKWLARHNA